jgi:hypothetical protein
MKIYSGAAGGLSSFAVLSLKAKLNLVVMRILWICEMASGAAPLVKMPITTGE